MVQQRSVEAEKEMRLTFLGKWAILHWLRSFQRKDLPPAKCARPAQTRITSTLTQPATLRERHSSCTNGPCQKSVARTWREP